LTVTVGFKEFVTGLKFTVGDGEIPVARHCHPKEFEAELIAPCKLIGNPRHTVSSMPALGCGGDSTVIVKTAVSRKTDDVAEAG
jgi:hypothetical protein